MDGGIRCAADVLKAVALGADAVLLGRPYAYALAVGGTRGVEELRAEPDGGDRPHARARRRAFDSRPRPLVAEPRRSPQRARRGRARGDRRRRTRLRARCSFGSRRPASATRDLHVIQEDGWGHPLPVLARARGRRHGRGGRRRRRRSRRGRSRRASAGTPPAASARRASAGCRVSAGGRRRPPDGCTARDGADLTPVLRTGTFATRTVVPAVAAVKIPRELPVEQACLLGCAVATGVMSVLETAQRLARRTRRGDRLRRRGPLGDPGRAHRRRVGDPRDRPRRAEAASRRCGSGRRTPSPGRSTSSSTSSAAVADVRAGARDARVGRDARRSIGLSPAGETATVDLPALFAQARADPRLARRRPSAARGLPAARAAGRSTARSTSRRWSRAPRRSTTGAHAFDAMQDGSVIRTVLTP